MKSLAIVLALMAIGAHALADTPSSGANPQIPVTQGTPENEELPMPAGSGGDDYVAPSKDVKPYAPLPKELYESTADLQAEPGKGSLPANPSSVTPAQKGDERIPGGPGDCALEGDAKGPTGCAILKQDRNHYEWPSELTEP